MYVGWYSVGFHTMPLSVAGTHFYIHMNTTPMLSKQSTIIKVKSGHEWLLLSPKTLAIVTDSKNSKISKANEMRS